MNSAHGTGREPTDIVVSVDGDAYSRDAISRACYALLDMASTAVSLDGRMIVVRVLPNDLSVGPEFIRHRFLDLLADYQLRTIIDDRTARIREVLITAALAEAAAGQRD